MPAHRVEHPNRTLEQTRTPHQSSRSTPLCELGGCGVRASTATTPQASTAAPEQRTSQRSHSTFRSPTTATTPSTHHHSRQADPPPPHKALSPIGHHVGPRGHVLARSPLLTNPPKVVHGHSTVGPLRSTTPNAQSTTTQRTQVSRDRSDRQRPSRGLGRTPRHQCLQGGTRSKQRFGVTRSYRQRIGPTPFQPRRRERSAAIVRSPEFRRLEFRLWIGR